MMYILSTLSSSMYKFIHLFQEFHHARNRPANLCPASEVHSRYLFLPETGDTSIERYPINPRTDTTMTFEALIRFP